MSLLAWAEAYSYGRFAEPLISERSHLRHLLYFTSRVAIIFDEMYSFYVNRVQDPFFRFLEVMELLFISGLMVRGAAGVAALFALLGKSFYSGKIHSYSFWFVLGTIGFLAYSIFGGGNS